MSLQTALVVDDSKLARITLQRLLEQRNYQVKLAESAKQALELLEQELPDIIFMDHLMPEMDGFEAMQRIKANPATQHIPIVMCTGKEGAENYDAEAKARGAAATLAKPPQPEQLSLVLQDMVTAQSPSAPVTAADAELTPQPEPTGQQELTTQVPELDQLRRELQEIHLPALAEQLSQQQQARYQSLEQQLQHLNERLLDEARIRELVRAELAEHDSLPANSPLISGDENFQKRLAELDERLGTLEQTRQEPIETTAEDTGSTAALEELRHVLESKLNSLEQDILQLRNAPAAQEIEEDVEALEQRLSEAALATVGPTLDAMLAHKTEQIRNQLVLELEAQLKDAPATATGNETVSAPLSAENVRRLAQEAASETLGHASEQLVAEITGALREEVESTQRELLARQEMFEQERAAMRRQIRQLRGQLFLATVGIGLVALIALAANFSF